jgi:hypothetical protein
VFLHVGPGKVTAGLAMAVAGGIHELVLQAISTGKWMNCPS